MMLHGCMFSMPGFILFQWHCASHTYHDTSDHDRFRYHLHTVLKSIMNARSGTPKDPQTKEQKVEDPKDLRQAARAADWQQMRMLLRRMPIAQINSGATAKEAGDSEAGASLVTERLNND